MDDEKKKKKKGKFSFLASLGLGKPKKMNKLNLSGTSDLNQTRPEGQPVNDVDKFLTDQSRAAQKRRRR